ncbi:ABC transporter substrate-binding protein [Agromyces mangrovi Wang et al. 2018]|uniref:ABC transporter substrate-binding protein n=1 Tax=Agromyces mangrovi TaxID=1858653 RepID=UPI00257396DE|nr:ABC transporter substrate-binding protein [Agromyces mangrovi]BDZ64436.1 hypothetical protein GCM10025877_13740 [Agromyces mangrovi]
MHSRTRLLRTGIALASAALITGSLAACATDGGGASSDGTVEITWLTPNDEVTVNLATGMIEAFQAEYPEITVTHEAQPGGTEGDNLIKTKLATGEMPEVFYYNSGSLLQALNPSQTLVDLSDEEWVDSLTDDFKRVVSTDDGLYGAPVSTSQAGGVIYNKPVFESLGLEVPTDWSEFLEVAEQIKAEGDGVVPVQQAFGDTWTSQLFILADFANVNTADPDWADDYTANAAKYADQPALAGFQHLQEVHDAGLLNEDFASATNDEAIRAVGEGTAAMYPMLSGAALPNIQQNLPDAVGDVGIFALPADDAANTALTVWQPNAVYIPNTTEGAELEAAKQLVAFINSEQGCEIQNAQGTAAGPFVTSNCEVPADSAPMVAEIQSYFDTGATAPALEFLSPIKGPSLENFAVEVGSGIRSAEDGAALYDEDVKKQAQQLGIEGW